MEPCKYEKEIGGMLKSIEHFEKFMAEIKDNHLAHIYEKLENITEKMSHRRPTWTVLWIISFLVSLTGILITAILIGK